MADVSDIVVFSLASFLGNVGVALTGFGMAIVYLFVWQIAVLAFRYDSVFTYAVFLQAIALFSAQPLLLRKAEIRKHASRRMLLYFIPVTVISTPLGQITGDRVSTDLVEAVGGVLVTFIATLEIFQKRALFAQWICGRFARKGEEEKADASHKGDLLPETTHLAEVESISSSGETPGAAGIVEVGTEDENKPSSDDIKADTTCKGVDEGEELEHMELTSCNGDSATAGSIGDAADTAATTECKRPQPVDIEANSSADTRNREAANKNSDGDLPLGPRAQFWTLFAGAASGFLGGLCGIRGPPIILYFMHPPYPVSFTKKSQRATGACVTATNVLMRIGYYLVDTLALDGDSSFTSDDWALYVAVIISSILGVLVGAKIFEYLKDSKDTIRGILAIFLLLCGISLLLSSYAGV